MARQYFTTGNFGIARRYPGEVHICQPGREGSRPVCGTYVSKRAEYQPCAAGIHEEYVTCQRCKLWLVQYRKRHLEKAEQLAGVTLEPARGVGRLASR